MRDTAHRRVIVFDFDGTLTVGDGPVLAYAREVAARLPASGTADFRADVARHLGPHRTEGAGCTADEATQAGGVCSAVVAIDDYDLVRHLALGCGADDELLAAAYLASRHQLATDTAPVTAPAGLPGLLRALAPHARLVLATNAPAVGLDRALTVLGVTGHFDAVHSSLGKPDGLHALLEECSPAGDPLGADGLFGVGDVWVNDLEPVWVRGGTTALLGPTGTGDPRATFHATHLTDLYPVLTAWALASAPNKG